MVKYMLRIYDILNYMKVTKFYTITIMLIFFNGCAIITDEYQDNQRKVISFLLEDLPIPSDAQIIKEPSVLLGTGNAISGRIVLESTFSPAENLIFYGTETLSTGWELVSSKVGEEITLVYSKSGRFATIFISPKRTLGSFFQGGSSSDINISVVHPNAIAIQNPYQDLDYDNLPDSP